jgi:hypothetical protein
MVVATLVMIMVTMMKMKRRRRRTTTTIWVRTTWWKMSKVVCGTGTRYDWFQAPRKYQNVVTCVMTDD